MASSGFGLTKNKQSGAVADQLKHSDISALKTKGSVIPDISEWNIVKSSEASDDGKTYKAESLATTEGVQKVPGGQAEYAGRSEQMKKASHQGDDKNYLKTSEESSKTQLEEEVVVGDERSGKIQQKSSSVSTSSTVKTSKKSSSGGDVIFDPEDLRREHDLLLDTALANERLNTINQQQQHQTSRVKSTSSTQTKEHQVREQHHEEHHRREHQHSQQTQNEHFSTKNTSDRDHHQSNQLKVNQNEQSQQVRRKLTQEELDVMSAAPGEILSRTVEYPDSNTKAITETKQLQDGTVVTIKRYEKKSSNETWSSYEERRRVEEREQKVVKGQSEKVCKQIGGMKI